jgi:hypothetical protein
MALMLSKEMEKAEKIGIQSEKQETILISRKRLRNNT